MVDSFEVCDLEPRQEAERDREYELVVERLFDVPVETQRRWRGEQMSVRAHPGRPRVLAFPDALYKSTHAIRQAQKIFPRIP